MRAPRETPARRSTSSVVVPREPSSTKHSIVDSSSARRVPVRRSAWVRLRGASRASSGITKEPTPTSTNRQTGLYLWQWTAGKGARDWSRYRPGCRRDLEHLMPAKPIYKSLYAQVITAIMLGVLLGHFYPDSGTAMKPLGEGFIRLIKMLI